MECEIFQIPFDEAKESYRNEIVFELQNDNEADLERNLKVVGEWIDSFKNRE